VHFNSVAFESIIVMNITINIIIIFVIAQIAHVNVKDRISSKELRERLGLDDIILALQQNRLR